MEWIYFITHILLVIFKKVQVGLQTTQNLEIYRRKLHNISTKYSPSKKRGVKIKIKKYSEAHSHIS